MSARGAEGKGEIVKVFLASFFAPQNHHGLLLSIARSKPPAFRELSDIPVLMPSAKLLGIWKRGDVESETEYTRLYLCEIGDKWGEIAAAIKALYRVPEITLLCWECEGEFCHRQIVGAKLKEQEIDVEIH
jgi:hypothetical protein